MESGDGGDEVEKGQPSFDVSGASIANKTRQDPFGKGKDEESLKCDVAGSAQFSNAERGDRKSVV